MKHKLATIGATIALGIVLPTAACDPVHDDATAALGDEAPGVRKGPLHRPGQPCTTCHDGKLGNPPEFSVAGTVYLNETDSTPANNATVTLTASDGATYRTITNAAGNFYVQPQKFTPRYPMKTSVSLGGITVNMTSEIGRAGSCADCHTAPAGPTSAGHIFIPEDGGTP